MVVTRAPGEDDKEAGKRRMMGISMRSELVVDV